MPTSVLGGGDEFEVNFDSNRAVLLKNGITIEPKDLALGPAPLPERSDGVKTVDGAFAIDLSKGIVLEELEKSIIERVLVQTGWNRTKAAQLLGLSRETLRYRIEKHELKPPAGNVDC